MDFNIKLNLQDGFDFIKRRLSSNDLNNSQPERGRYQMKQNQSSNKNVRSFSAIRSANSNNYATRGSNSLVDVNSKNFNPDLSLSSNVPADIVADKTTVKKKIILFISDKNFQWDTYFNTEKEDTFYDVIQTTIDKFWKLVDFDKKTIQIHDKTHCLDLIIFQIKLCLFIPKYIRLLSCVEMSKINTLNSPTATFNMSNYQWKYSHLCQIREKVTAQVFPLIKKSFSNDDKSFKYPILLKIVHDADKIGKMVVYNSEQHAEICSTIDKEACVILEPFIDKKWDFKLYKIGSKYKGFTRKTNDHYWNYSKCQCTLDKINITPRYKLWLNEISLLFGGLDVVCVKGVMSMNGELYINDVEGPEFTMYNKVEDCKDIANVIKEKIKNCTENNKKITLMIPARPKIARLEKSSNSEVFDQTKPQRAINNPKNNFKSVEIANSPLNNEDDTMDTLRKTFAGIFGNL
ncbi:Synapsin III [Intoshia linei]|uniref:Synapsin III n=1 Tax=Intoshia linei TaxID=1819745 RepID=A0A177AS72_9BILA|nr:Synapsin III [Intoshia linei]